MVNISFFKYIYYLFLAYVKFLFTFVIAKFQDYPNEIRVAALVAVVCVMIMVVMWIAMFFKSIGNRRRARLREHLADRYGEGMRYVISEATHKMTADEILRVFDVDVKSLEKPLLKNEREKELLVEIFYRLFITRDSDVAVTENIHASLQLFDIPNFLEKVISLGRMKRKVEALNVVRTFKLQISPWVINKLLNSKYMSVKRLAMYSTIMSSSDSALEYFETDFFDKNSCIKDEIELAYSLQRRRKAGLKLPNLARWAHIQTNERTQCMCVRLMRRFNEVEYCGQLTDLYSQSRKKKLIEEISRTWGYLHYLDCEQLLIETLLTQPDDTKVAIMHAMTRLGTGKSMGALLEGFKNTTNPHVQFEALRCIYNYGEEGRAKFYELEQKATEEEKKFFSFFKNPITFEKIRLDREQAYHPSVETVFNG